MKAPAPTSSPTNRASFHSLRKGFPTNLFALLALCEFGAGLGTAHASIAYGTINNFDTVNDTGHECHGFEIEIEDCHSTGVSYTYNYNHYGVPKITEDTSIPGHPKCIIRWESKKNADGTWAAYTAIPAGPITPTNGHMFTNPAVNFGGEHFGVGYNAAGAVHYRWLIDNGAGVLMDGGAVQVSTPVFNYYPAGGGAAAQMQAVIAPPPPPAPEPKEFGEPVWVKEIRTTTHKAEKVKLRDLVSADPAKPNAKNWKNGEPDEVETEWQLLQKDHNQADGGANNKVAAAAEDLPGGDEVVTRRYEFFKYIGPIDAETGEAMGDNVAADGLHGVGTKVINSVNVNLANVVVVGEFTGAQMAAADAAAAVGLIDHVGEGKINTAYAARTVVVQGAQPVTTTHTGALPAGMTFNDVTGILAGTPTVSGTFAFKVASSDGVNPDVEKNYTLRIAAAAVALAPANLVDTSAAPAGSGTTAGDGAFAVGANVTVTATPNAGFRFVNWTDNNEAVGVAASHTFVADVNHSLVANFTPDVPQRNIVTSATPIAGGTTRGGGLKDDGTSVTVVATANAGYAFTNWTEGATVVSTTAGTTFIATADRTLTANFTPLPTYTVATSATTVAGGTTTGGGSYFSGTSATVVATASVGYVFTKWTAGGSQASTAPSYTFTVTVNKTLVANFVLAGQAKTIATSGSPAAGGTTGGGGSYVTGDSVTVVAVANPGYKFSKWQEGSSNVSSAASYTFTVAGNRTLVAKFTRIISITASASPDVGGTTEMDSSSYKVGDNAQAKAFPAAGYSFANWTENGVVVSTAATYSFNVTADRALVANFTSNTGVTITTNSAPAAGGTMIGAGAYQIGDDVTVSAVPNAGFAFANWTVAGAVVSSDADYTFTAAASRALVANFAPAITIAAIGSPAAGGVILGAGDYVSGASVTLGAFANPDFLFSKWTEGGVTVSTSPLYAFTVTAARSLVANFTPAYAITASEWPVGGGTVLGAASVTAGSSITLVAAATAGYTFVNWTDINGNEVSTSASYTFTPTASGDYAANFSTGLAGVHFNFDSGIPLLPLHTALPFSQTVAGLTASFSSPNAVPPTIETEASSAYVLSKFAAHFIAPSAETDTMIEIHFDALISGVAFNFATTEDPGVAVGSNIHLIATDHSSGVAVPVGNALAHGSTVPGDSFPTGTLTFNSGVPFDTIRIELAAFPSGAQKLMIDNLIVSPAGSTGGTMLLANPNWNITLSSYGYSDYLLDNTPGFEGREYLSGEWGSAIGYTKDGVPVGPIWFDPNFLYPDWRSNSTFQVVQDIHLVAANLDGLPIAESVIANSDLEITLRFEMVDTITGTPMGTAPASAGGAGTSVNSNRYVLNQSFHVRNISGAAITNVQLFQFMHGLTSQHGSYDNRAYAGKLSQYHYDATLAGVDASSAGAAGSSATGLEDAIAFHSKVAPTAFEIGYYGIEGNGLDDHSVGKPSDGVHLSIEDNWQSAPFGTRQGRDNFAPPTRWVAGGQRWTLGNLAAGQSSNFDILLSLLTGTKVTAGGGYGSCNGGSSHVGGVDFDFDNATSAGTFFGEASEADDNEMAQRKNAGQFALPTFQTPGTTTTQIWNLKYSGTHNGQIHLTFAYDPALLPAGFDESRLVIWHYNGTAWENLHGTVNPANHKITVTTASLSPFALGFTSNVAIQLPAGGGTVTGGGSYGTGENVTLTVVTASLSPFALGFTSNVTIQLPTGGGTVTGGGSYGAGENVTLTATPQPGYWFTDWTEGGNVVSTAPNYTFTITDSRMLLANFAFMPKIALGAAATPGTISLAWPNSATGWTLQESTDLVTWTTSTRDFTNSGGQISITVTPAGGRTFFRLVHP